MSQQDILMLAKHGDPRAIAFLLNQALQTKGVTAKGTRQDNSLHILLEAEQLPIQDACIRVVIKGLLRLQVTSLSTVTLYGRRLGQQLPGWTQTVELKKPVEPISIAPPPLPVSPQPPIHPPKPVETPAVSPRPAIATAPKPQPRRRPASPVAKKHSPQRSSSPATTPPNPWLFAASVSVVLVPLSGFVLTSQLYKAETSISNFGSGIWGQSNPSASPVAPSVTLQTAAAAPAPKLPPQTIPQAQPASVTLPLQKNLPAPNTVISIKAVGDIIPGTTFPYNKLPKQPELLFKSVKPGLSGADILFGNFESTLTDYPYSSKGGGGGMLFAFRTPPSYKKFLKDAGFDILNVANNHSWDFNEQGFKDTMKHIDSTGMKSFGKKDQIIYHTVKGVTVAFIGFSNYGDVHNSLLDLKGGAAIVKRAREKADIVAISVHAGAEGTGALHVKNKNEFFYGENRGNMVLFSRTMIDAGADLILGHGPHVPRAMELYKGKLIAYSLGNFMGYRTLSTAAELGQSLILEAKLNPKGDFVSGRIIPVALDGRGIPYLDDRKSSVRLIRNLTKIDFPNTPLAIDDKGQILKKSSQAPQS